MVTKGNISVLLILFVLLIGSLGTATARTIYVDANTPDNNDGSSWAKAYKFLQDALADANSSGDVNEIWVAQGTYNPDANSSFPDGTGDREATFQLINGVALRGGYAGYGEVDANDRDWELYETVLSGDLEGNDGEVAVLGLLNEPSRSENSYHVVTCSGTDTNTLLDGLIITSGNANGVKPNDGGGGVYIDNKNLSYPTHLMIADSIITKNSAGNDLNDSIQVGGGGLLASARHAQAPIGSLTLTNCSFSENQYIIDSPLGGGGGLCVLGSPFSMNRCIFKNNMVTQASSSNEGGGGAYCSGGIIENCTFIGNYSNRYGGALHVSGGIIENCTFVGNSSHEGGAINVRHFGIFAENCSFFFNAASRGSAIYNFDVNPASTLSNCTFSGNYAYVSGTLYSSGHVLANSILWGNSVADGYEVTFSTGTVNVIYSNIQGGQSAIETGSGVLTWGMGNINNEPNFVKIGHRDLNGTPTMLLDDFWVDGDYHLQSQAGRWDSNSENWFQDDVTSPCIDAGDPDSSIGYELFPNGGRVNMGAYGGTVEASKSYFGEPVCEKNIAGDINGDCIIDFVDFAFMARHWLEGVE